MTQTLYTTGLSNCTNIMSMNSFISRKKDTRHKKIERLCRCITGVICKFFLWKCLIIDALNQDLREKQSAFTKKIERLCRCSSQQGLLLVPFARTSAKQSRAFSVVGPSTWIGLPSQLRTLPRALSPAFLSQLKTALFSRAGVGSASE